MDRAHNISIGSRDPGPMSAAVVYPAQFSILGLAVVFPLYKLIWRAPPSQRRGHVSCRSLGYPPSMRSVQRAYTRGNTRLTSNPHFESTVEVFFWGSGGFTCPACKGNLGNWKRPCEGAWLAWYLVTQSQPSGSESCVVRVRSSRGQG